MKVVKIKISSICPLLMHSDRTANPLNSHAKSLKEVTSKRTKTDDDHLEISRREFIASTYYENSWYIPSANIEAMLLASAKNFKLGTTIKQALLVPEDGVFDFRHKSMTPEQLFNLPEYVDQRTVKISTSKNVRTRPIFREWSIVFVCYLDTDKMNVEQLIQIIENAGKYVGIGDYRPRFGRFSVVNTEVSNG